MEKGAKGEKGWLEKPEKRKEMKGAEGEREDSSRRRRRRFEFSSRGPQSYTVRAMDLI